MSYLINRTPPARLRCLYYLLKLAYSKFGTNEFTMGDLLFDSGNKNIHHYCKLLKNDKNLNIRYCPFLQNPLSLAGCYLTRGVLEDSTKKKEISNSMNSLDALGLIDRTERKFRVTEFGIKFANSEFKSNEWLEIAREAVCNYGLAVGMLFQISKCDDNFNAKKISVGYPTPREFVIANGEQILISSGSQNDSNTRTKSCILAWFSTVGFIVPESLKESVNFDRSHLDTDSYITNNSTRNEQKYVKINIPKIFSGNFSTKKPFDYKNLTKDIKALRENGQKSSRQKTMECAHIIRNRRYAILYTLNFCFENNYLLNFDKLIQEMKKYEEYFVINKSDFNSIMTVELEIAFAAGIPYELIGDNLLKPVTGLNVEILNYGAPEDLVNLIDKRIKNNVYELSL